MKKSGGRATRVPVSLECTACKTRNYKTTKAPGKVLELKKFCVTCGAHTVHRETN